MSNYQVPKILLVGGPKAGKTTCLQVLQETFGRKIVAVPEAASLLFKGGYPLPEGKMTLPGSTWQWAFQPAVVPLQFALEQMAEEQAKNQRARIIVCDRGPLEGVVYLGKPVADYPEIFGQTVEEVCARYDLIIHLESVACCNPSLFNTDGNGSRYESLDVAAEREQALQQVWRCHPNWRFISGAEGIESVVDQVVALVAEYVQNEIERKFLLPGWPAIDTGSGIPYRQGYLPLQVEARPREEGRLTFFTVKGSGTLMRKEWQRPCPRWVFEQFWPDTEGRRVYKRRHWLELPDDRWDQLAVDRYQRQLEGLFTLESEFVSKEEAASFELPVWAKGAVEITDDPAYKNRNLAIHGLPKAA